MQSVEEAQANNMIDAVKVLANRAVTYDHLDEMERKQLMSLLLKLQGSPAKSFSDEHRHGGNTEGRVTNQDAHRKLAGAGIAVTAVTHLKARAGATAGSGGHPKALAPLSPVNELGTGEEEAKEAAGFPNGNSGEEDEKEEVSPLTIDRMVSADTETEDDFMSVNSDDTEGDEIPLELAAPTIIPKVSGRLHVTARTVVLELPADFRAARAALVLLTKLRRSQQRRVWTQTIKAASASDADGGGETMSGGGGDNFDLALHQLAMATEELMPGHLKDGGKELDVYQLMMVQLREKRRLDKFYDRGMDPFPLTAGDSVKVVKPNSSKLGMIATVIDPDWQNLVKVDMAGSVKSYRREHLHKLGRGGKVDLEEGKDVARPHAAPLATGDRVKVVKPNSSKQGLVAEVLDPQWHGLVKVKLKGKIKSYNRAHLHKLARTDSLSLEVDVDELADMSELIGSGVGGTLEPPPQNLRAASEPIADGGGGRSLAALTDSPLPDAAAAAMMMLPEMTPRTAFLKQGSEKDNDLLSMFH